MPGGPAGLPVEPANGALELTPWRRIRTDPRGRFVLFIAVFGEEFSAGAGAVGVAGEGEDLGVGGDELAEQVRGVVVEGDVADLVERPVDETRRLGRRRRVGLRRELPGALRTPHRVDGDPVPADGGSERAADHGVDLPHRRRRHRLADVRGAAGVTVVIALDPVDDEGSPATASGSVAALRRRSRASGSRASRSPQVSRVPPSISTVASHSSMVYPTVTELCAERWPSTSACSRARTLTATRRATRSVPLIDSDR